MFVRNYQAKGLIYMRNNIIPYNRKLVPLARKLRNNSTLSEILLWKKLRKRQMMGYDFDRQKPIGNYIVDFYCADLTLAIEVDGSSHDFKYEEDIIRQEDLEKLGVTLVRFKDIEVKKEMDSVLNDLKWEIEQILDKGA